MKPFSGNEVAGGREIATARLPNCTTSRTQADGLLRILRTGTRAVEWQLVVLDARAIGEGREARGHRGGDTLPSCSGFVALALGWRRQRASDRSQPSWCCRRADRIEQHGCSRTRRDHELRISVPAGIDNLTRRPTRADRDD